MFSIRPGLRPSGKNKIDVIKEEQWKFKYEMKRNMMREKSKK